MHEEFDFYVDSNYDQGHALTLHKVSNGNLETEKINESSYPKQ